MSSFTIHSIDEELDIRLTERAKRAGVSKNQLIKDILARETGLSAAGGLFNEYREFFGVWSKEEVDEFDARQADNSRIDLEDWKP